jgi:hypothetical protein
VWQTLKRLPIPSIALALAVAAAAILVYHAAPGTYFYNDDFQWLLAANSFRWADWLNPWAHDHFFRPLPDLYFHLARLAWGGSAPAYHLASVLLHLLNAILVWRIGTLLSGRRVFAVAALCFVVQPGPVEAVTWVCAVSTVFAGTFYLTTAWFHIRYLERHTPASACLAAGSFALCLASHESSVMLLPLLYVVECVRERRVRKPWERDRYGFVFSKYLPYAALLGVYLGAEYVVNARNYVVTEGHYALGLHVFRNLVDYVIALHLGQHTTAVRIAVVAVSALLLALGSGRVRLYTLWIWLTLVPASLFTWPNVARYEYLPAIGLALLVTEGVVFAESLLRRVGPRRLAAGAAVVLMTVVVVRSAAFAYNRVQTFQRTAEPYRTFVTEFQREHPAKPSGRTVTAIPFPPDLPPTYIEAAIRFAYDDPGITLVLTPPGR